MVRCKLCGEEKEDRFFKFENGKIRKRTCQPCLGQRERGKLKLRMLEALGFECACCGENNPYFLTLDHVNNDGGKEAERYNYNQQQIIRLAHRQSWPKDKYQVLCMNCNFAKGHFKECPHKLGITAEVALADLRRKVHTYMRTRHDRQAEYNGNQWGKLKEKV